MATSFINAISNGVGTADVIVFTAVSKSIVIGGVLTNTTASTVPVTIKLRRVSTDTYLHKDKRLEAGTSFELSGTNKLILAVGDKIIVSSKVASSVDVVFSILQGVA